MYSDIHTHIIPGIDDGAKTTEAALQMLSIAHEQDPEALIALTPHYIEGVSEPSPETVARECQKLQSLAAAQFPGLKLVPGSEVFIFPGLPNYLQAGKIPTVNNSRYVLVELPSASVPEYTDEIIFQTLVKGFVPIICHPERNRQIQKDNSILARLVSRGALAQMNSGSLLGTYGHTAKETVIELLNQNLIHFAASDAHSPEHRSPDLTKAYDILASKYTRKMADALFCVNGMLVVENLEVPRRELVITGKSGGDYGKADKGKVTKQVKTRRHGKFMRFLASFFAQQP